MTASDEDAYVCSECIGDKVLKELVLSEGESGQCTYCGSKANCLPLKKLANQVHEVIEENFYLTASEPGGVDYLMAKEGLWERPGEQVHLVISNIAEVSEDIAKAIRDCLSEQFGYDAIRDGEDDPYGDDALYDEKSIDDRGFRESWDFFKANIKTSARFFSQHAQQVLDEIFEGLGTLKTISGTPVIREIMPTDADIHFYRARVSFSEHKLKEILAAPVKELGPPPSRSAKAGRMNAAGISMFYGAVDDATCIAEARAPVGSYVVLGRFEIIRPLRVLDFDALREVYIEGSYFDPDYHARWKRASFLRRLVQEITRPVMPRDEEFEYLPTQVVSEYLAQRIEPRLDGIFFHSSQTGGEGRNVVLFNHACRIEPYDLPEGTAIDFNMAWETEDDYDYDDSITVFENVPPEKKEEPTQEKTTSAIPFGLNTFEPDTRGYVALSGNDADDCPDYRDPVLRLDVDGIRILHIRSVKYKHHERSVSRHRTTDEMLRKY